ncbi:MAG: glucosaminidase domain-containing protein [Lachnospiraceae bacterium]|nr:glucosaminidase domain-containing protein [Lachnospiraceae bacterium]
MGIKSPIYAQFNTVLYKRDLAYEILPKRINQTYNTENNIDTDTPDVIVGIDTIPDFSLKDNSKTSLKEPIRKKHLDLFKTYEGLPPLTISNLLLEIRKNGIQHEKVVLAQAILETGWFTSSVCRNKNNLFGLVNPRTGEYYEFEHWTESVRAYYTKVQYRFKGGNYLLWLDEIGYAEKRTYIEALIRLLNQYFI